jgi:hypothetical protein
VPIPPNTDPHDHGTRVAGCLGGRTSGLRQAGITTERATVAKPALPPAPAADAKGAAAADAANGAETPAPTPLDRLALAATEVEEARVGAEGDAAAAAAQRATMERAF